MSDEQTEDPGAEYLDADEAELEDAVVAYVEAFADRVSSKMLDAESPAEAVSEFVKALKSDGGLMQLLGNAFDDGRRDAMLAAARFADADGPTTTWDGTEGGERLVLWREGHVCNSCVHASVCVVQRALPAEMLVQVRRCLAYEEQRS